MRFTKRPVPGLVLLLTATSLWLNACGTPSCPQDRCSDDVVVALSSASADSTPLPEGDYDVKLVDRSTASSHECGIKVGPDGTLTVDSGACVVSREGPQAISVPGFSPGNIGVRVSLADDSDTPLLDGSFEVGVDFLAGRNLADVCDQPCQASILSVQVPPPPVDVGPQCRVQLYSPANQQLPTVDLLRVATAKDGEEFGEQLIIGYPADGLIEVNNSGLGIRVVVEGWKANASGGLGVMRTRGWTVPINCDGDLTPANLLIADVNSIADVTSAVSGAAVPLEHGRVGHAVVATAANEIVISGGKSLNSLTGWWAPGDAEEFLTSVEVIDAANHSRRTLKNMYFPRVWHTATAVPGTGVFFAGGFTNAQGVATPLKHVEYYGGGEAEISTLQMQMEVARTNHTATVIDDIESIHLFVGGDAEGPGGTFEVWNPLTGSAAAQPMPGGKHIRHHAAVRYVHNGATFVVIAGGQDKEGNVSDAVFLYNAADDKMLQYVSKLSAPRTQLAAVWQPSRDYIYFMGGYTTVDRSAVSNAVDVFDFRADTLGAPSGFKLKTPRGGHSAARTGDSSIVMVGGTDGVSPLSAIEVVYEYVNGDNSVVIDTATSNSDPNSGPLVPFIPQARLGAQAVLAPNSMALISGGANDASMPTELYFYNP